MDLQNPGMTATLADHIPRKPCRFPGASPSLSLSLAAGSAVETARHPLLPASPRNRSGSYVRGRELMGLICFVSRVLLHANEGAGLDSKANSITPSMRCFNPFYLMVGYLVQKTRCSLGHTPLLYSHCESCQQTTAISAFLPFNMKMITMLETCNLHVDSFAFFHHFLFSSTLEAAASFGGAEI